ncbi:DNA repair endonuclease [Agrobacterium phage OLIVR2]|uniref:DNA repair endonuclease n=1 Tax=Agrobacterium phage OLIVR1 TaxID=2723769 RepID=A0A858MR44_9CAUD|nr:hypothetical protein [Xanthomonas campestris]YP_010107093.1 5'-3' deoxyribonucleotidase [Agrobacterium phage OLIVR1]QIW87362.1 DNA repair endonuclease [Agrobacterium phage OLIVR2]QIW87469.1 DNA repair endonuclease [Agrobacterium phage OLIVR3]MCF8861641.1 hypothetical protein [Xanthomonas campestris pv. campestris]QIW87254.1 DNA repair endonuclease [Agrobacterium phage OLIVR1]
MRRLFVDLDGVMADFDTHFRNLFNCDPPSKIGGVNDDEMWKLIHDKGDFFETIPVFEGTLSFWKKITDYADFDPIILTAASKKHYHAMAIQKRKWVRQTLSTEHLILPVWGSSSKTLFMHAPGDVLIDDYKKNCDRWNAAGGYAIHHTDFDKSFKELIEIMETPFFG